MDLHAHDPVTATVHRWALAVVVAVVSACSASDEAAESTQAATEGSDGGHASADAGPEPGTGGNSADSSPDEGTDGDPTDPDAPLVPEAGMVELDPVSYTLAGQSLTSSSARLFWAFHPADENAHEKPVTLFFNGGPGAGAGILFAFNIGRTTLDPQQTGGAPVADNPTPWTSFTNCLFIDARLAGFSYGLLDDPSDDAARAAEFSVKNFNPYIDAADLTRVLLRFLADHPTLQDNEIMLVGESYGGVRAATILDLVLFYRSHADGTSTYQDPALVEEIEAHFGAVFPDGGGDALPPETIATQFGHQVLIQPLVAGEPQLAASGELLNAPDSPLFALGDEVGVPFAPAPAFDSGAEKRSHAIDYVRSLGRDTSNIAEAEGWTDDRITIVNNNGYRDVDNLAVHLGVDPTSIGELFADQRGHAYRFEDASAAAPPSAHEPFEVFGDLARDPRPVAATPWQDVFGPLSPWDGWYDSFSSDVFNAFYGADVSALGVEPTSSAFGPVTLRNLLYVDTFITHAAHDVVVWPPAIAPALATWDEYVQFAANTSEPVAGEARPGRILIQYQSGAFGYPGGPQSREIRFPFYDASSHSVVMNQPAELLADVRDWY